MLFTAALLYPSEGPVYTLNNSWTSLEEGMEYLEDPDGIYSLEMLNDPDDGIDFTVNQRPVLDFGLKDGFIWLKFSLVNLKDMDDWTLEFDIHKFYTLEVYQKQKGEEFSSTASYSYKQSFSERTVKEAHLAIPLKLPQGEQTDFLIRISSENGLVLPMKIYDKPSYFNKISHRHTEWAIIYTVMIIMTVYNLFIYLYVRDLNYLYYVLYVVLYMFYLSALNGAGAQYIWPELSGRWTTIFSPLFGGLSLALGIILMRQFLEFKESSPRLKRYMISLIALSLLLSVSNILVESFKYSYTLGNILGAVILFSILAISFKAVLNGNRAAIIFLTSYIMVILGQIAYSLKAIGYFSTYPVFQNLNQYAPLIQVILLSHSLSYRISLLRKEKDLALAATLKAETTLAEELEKKVEERTRELQIANNKLQELSNQDGLTGLYNRRFFDRALSAELNRHQRSALPLSLILCDIDHFKRFNDTAGHLAGDDCLKKVANGLQISARRETDIAARYGGEEFALILPQMNRTSALEIAEKIQETLIELKLIHPDYKDSGLVTLSFGIATVIPGPQTVGEELIAAADRALYESKNLGRNRITSEEI